MATQAVRAGERLGPYELLAPIGAGGMGEVWRARDTRLDRLVAIKFCSAQFTERFEREARAIAALNHPNIAQIHDVGENYIVMEYIEGEPVRSPDNVRKLLDVAVQIADGLAAAHAAGFVHRDLKPDNILLTKDGRVKILDFGLAKSAAAAGKADATQTIAVTNSCMCGVRRWCYTTGIHLPNASLSPAVHSPKRRVQSSSSILSSPQTRNGSLFRFALRLAAACG